MKSVDDALAEILASVAPLGAETAELFAAQGRVLAAPVISQRTLPPWDNSEMDGYAVAAADLANLPVSIQIQGVVPAGYLAEKPLLPECAYRIFTGAPLPAGADTVVKQEDASATGDRVTFTRPVTTGQHVRRRGSDVLPGRELLPAGTVLGPGELGLCAALGRTTLAVVRRPLVAILSTGDELVEPDVTPGPGQIVNSNSIAVAAQALAAGAQVLRLGIARDARDELRARLLEARRADVLVTLGGVSVGERDYVKEVLAELGCDAHFWGVDVKPGRRLLFGTWDGRAVFGLPGNPVSSMVTFELFVRPALRRLAGHERVLREVARARLSAPVRKGDGHRHYLRAWVQREDGELVARPNPRQGSGQLTSMVGVNALVILPEASSGAASGELVEVLLFGDV